MTDSQIMLLCAVRLRGGAKEFLVLLLATTGTRLPLHLALFGETLVDALHLLHLLHFLLLLVLQANRRI